MSYFNTTHEPKNQVKLFVKINKQQDLNCLRIIQTMFKNTTFTVHDVYLQYLHKHFKNSVIKMSIGRTINTLKRAGWIMHTVDENGNVKKVVGPHKRKVFEYILTKQ